MGGLGPGIGGLEILVIGLVALLVVGPKDLPVLMRKVGKAMGKARAMANEFRSSFDEMARQSELDELRKEVEALRTGQGMHALGADADAAFREIGAELNRSPDAPMLTGPSEWPDTPPVMTPLPPIAGIEPVKPKTKPKPRKAASSAVAKGVSKTAPKSKPQTAKAALKAAAKPRATRAPKVAS